jgi:hypothetical protein
MTMTNRRTRSMFPAATAIAALLAVAPFAATAGAQQRGRATAKELPATPSAMGLHGYSVVLVIGDMTAASAADTVPAAARKALTDMQAFLPYKRYQLLDAAWMVCCGSFRSTLSGRVRGPENGEYLYGIDTLNGTDDSKLTVRFSMRDATGTTAPVVAAGRVSSSSSAGGRGGSSNSVSRSADADARENLRMASETMRVEHSRQLYEAIKERDEAELVLRSAKERFQDSHPQLVAPTARYTVAQRRVDDLQHMVQAQGGGVGGGGGGRSPAGRSIMDSTFSIALGETVVIGTSRLKGDQALIVLLTAATKPGSPR